MTPAAKASRARLAPKPPWFRPRHPGAHDTLHRMNPQEGHQRHRAEGTSTRRAGAAAGRALSHRTQNSVTMTPSSPPAVESARSAFMPLSGFSPEMPPSNTIRAMIQAGPRSREAHEPVALRLAQAVPEARRRQRSRQNADYSDPDG